MRAATEQTINNPAWYQRGGEKKNRNISFSRNVFRPEIKTAQHVEFAQNKWISRFVGGNSTWWSWMESLNSRLERVSEAQIKKKVQPLCCCVCKARHHRLQTTREKKPITCSVSLVVDSIWRMQTQPVCPEGTGCFHGMRGIKAKRKFNKQIDHATYKTIYTFEKVDKRSFSFLFQFLSLTFLTA